MTRFSFAAVLAAALPAALAPAPAIAQSSGPRAGVIQIFGDDKCPTNADGEEIVVCERLDEKERFRIPKNLREMQVTPQNESWARQQQAALEAGESGIGSCSAIGVGGATGCFADRARAWKAERQAQAKEAAELPVP